jgi:AP2 domain
MRTIPLYGKRAAGRVALIDDEDYKLVMAYRWNANLRGNTTYAMAYLRGSGAGGNPCANVMMHKLITGWPQTDHIDHNGLNNQRANLRPATQAQNQANSLPQQHSSRYRGVRWYRRVGKWMAQIKINGRAIHLGYFLIEEDAAHAYDRAALAAWGEYACLNFPGGVTS